MDAITALVREFGVTEVQRFTQLAGGEESLRVFLELASMIKDRAIAKNDMKTFVEANSGVLQSVMWGGTTACLEACFHDAPLDIVQYLYEHDPLLRQREAHRGFPFSWIYGNGTKNALDVMRFLIETKDPRLTFKLHDMIRHLEFKGSYGIHFVEYAVKTFPEQFAMRDKDGNLPLHCCAL